jgi:hypothetical protein
LLDCTYAVAQSSGVEVLYYAANNPVWLSPSTRIVSLYSRMGRTSRRPGHRGGVQSCRLLIASVQLPCFDCALSIRWQAEAGERSLLAWSIGLTMCSTAKHGGQDRSSDPRSIPLTLSRPTETDKPVQLQTRNLAWRQIFNR